MGFLEMYSADSGAIAIEICESLAALLKTQDPEDVTSNFCLNMPELPVEVRNSDNCSV